MSVTKETTIELIKNTAYKLFVERGYDKVTVNEICQACGIVKSTFYYHVKSKEELISHLYDNICEIIYSNVPEIIKADNYWEALWKCIEPILQFSTEIGPDLNVQSLKANLNNDIGTYDLKEELKKISIPLIEKAQQLGQIRNQSRPEDLYEATIHAIYGYDLVWCIKKGNFNKIDKTRKTLEALYDIAPENRF